MGTEENTALIPIIPLEIQPMGMFDYVNCEAPMPRHFNGLGRMFQTKDLDLDLDTYTIKSDGSLERKLARKSESIPFMYTGDIQFYDWFIIGQRGWVEFSANFIDGKLQSIACVHMDDGGLMRSYTDLRGIRQPLMFHGKLNRRGKNLQKLLVRGTFIPGVSTTKIRESYLA